MTEELTPRATIDTEHSAPRYSPDGRFGRLRFLLYSTWVPLGLYIAGALLSAVAGELLGTLLLVVALIGAVVFTVIFYIKRCHDFDRSGWWSVGLILPLINLVYVFIPGTDGPNRFGPKPPPNTWVEWVFGLGGFLVLSVGGILAAIAVPAYQDYTARVQIGEAFTIVGTQKVAVAEYAQTRNALPDRAAIDALFLNVQNDAGKYVESVIVTPGTGLIVATMKQEPAVVRGVAGRRIAFCPPQPRNFATLERFEWTCSSDAEQLYLPRACTGGQILSCE